MAQIPQLPDIYSVWHLAIGYAPEKRRYGKHWLELAQNPTFEELHRALINRSQTTVKVSAYRSLSHSVLACARMEEFGSASFQSERKFRYAAFAFAVSPVSA